MKERLHKILAHAGFGSRRKCEERILAGDVRIDGKVVTELGIQLDPSEHDVRCGGKPVKSEPRVVLLLNKPRGYVCTTSDERGRPTVLDLVRSRFRLYPAGRLDADSQGMIILTNDGELCTRLTHPRHEVEKSYHAVVRGFVPGEVLDRIQRGIWLSEGRTARSKIRVIRRDRESTVVEITLREGRKREVRRLFARFGLKVRRLKRIRIGGLTLGGLREGEHRPLSTQEIGKLIPGRSLDA